MLVYLPDLLRWHVVSLPQDKGLTEAFILSQGSPQPALGGGVWVTHGEDTGLECPHWLEMRHKT